MLCISSDGKEKDRQTVGECTIFVFIIQVEAFILLNFYKRLIAKAIYSCLYLNNTCENLSIFYRRYLDNAVTSLMLEQSKGAKG